MLNQDNVGVKRWLTQLVDPSLGAQRMPSPVPVETCLYSTKEVYSFSVDSSGEFQYCLTPGNSGMMFFVSSRATSAPAYGTQSHTGRDALVGNHTINTRYDLNAPSTYSECWRVVGASVCVKYIGRLDAASGIIRTCSSINHIGSGETELTIANIVDGLTAKAVKTPGVSYNTWYPHDLSAFDFTQGNEDQTSTQVNLHGYGYGFENSSKVEIELCVNYEYIPKVTHQELLGSNAQYGPVTSNGMLGTVTRELKSNLSGLYNNNKSSIISSILGSLGGLLSPGISLPAKALMLM